ncbi:hypothetical protein AAMO2058_000414400 [Amorphochlora amoebiformis]
MKAPKPPPPMPRAMPPPRLSAKANNKIKSQEDEDSDRSKERMTTRLASKTLPAKMTYDEELLIKAMTADTNRRSGKVVEDMPELKKASTREELLIAAMVRDTNKRTTQTLKGRPMTLKAYSQPPPSVVTDAMLSNSLAKTKSVSNLLSKPTSSSRSPGSANPFQKCLKCSKDRWNNALFCIYCGNKFPPPFAARTRSSPLLDDITPTGNASLPNSSSEPVTLSSDVVRGIKSDAKKPPPFVPPSQRARLPTTDSAPTTISERRTNAPTVNILFQNKDSKSGPAKKPPPFKPQRSGTGDHKSPSPPTINEKKLSKTPPPFNKPRIEAEKRGSGPLSPETLHQVNSEGAMKTTNSGSSTLEELLGSWRLRYSKGNKRLEVRKLGECVQIGILFSVANSGPCERFTQMLIETYSKLRKRGAKFEVVLVPLDETKKGYQAQHSKMPWPSVDFEHQKLRKHLTDKFGVLRTPTLVFVDPQANVVTRNGRKLVTLYKDDGFPFTEDLPSSTQNKIDTITV